VKVRITYTGTFPAHSDTGRLIILSNDPVTPRRDVMLSGSSFGVAHVTVRPDTFYFSRGATSDTTLATFKVVDSGTDTLHYSISESAASLLREARAIERSRKQQRAVTLPKGVQDPSPGERDSMGGPDAYGYRWIDSDSPGGPAFNWIDISTVGTLITTWTGTADDGYAAVPFPMSFSFYGTTFNSNINICTNGFLSFTSTATTYTNAAIPSTGAPLNGIFPFWDDLYLVTSGSVYYYYDAANSQFIVEYLNVPHFTSGGPYTVEVIFKADGRIIYQYQTMDLASVNSCTIGVQDAAGAVGLQVVFNSNYIHNGLALLISRDILPWMSTSPTRGTVAPGDSQSVSLRIHPAGLAQGLYTGYQRITGNTPDTSASVQVHLNVVPGTSSLTLTTPNGGEIWTAGTSHAIGWTKTGSVDSVRLDVSTTGAGGPWILIAPGVSARSGGDRPDGTFDWAIPAGLSSSNCFIRAAWKSNPSVFDVSNAAFTIQGSGPPDTTIVVSHFAGWSLISLPVRNPIPDDSARHLFPSVISRVFLFSNGYLAGDTMVFGYGYWAKFPSSGSDSITGTLVIRDSITVVPGWNLLGSISRVVDAGSVTTDPPGLSASNWFTFSGSGYVIASQIIPGRGYFVKSRGAGVFIFANPALNAASRVGSSGRGLAEVLNSITFTDSRGGSQTLYFGSDVNKEISSDAYIMPPRPPSGGFDARFETADGGSLVQMHAVKVQGSTDFPVSIQSDAYPVTVSWNVSKETASYELTDNAGGRAFPSIRMTGQGRVKLNNSEVSRVTITVGSEEQLPTEFALAQNYPNPFNPTTTIKYDLPADTRVSLKIFNIIGQEVATLVNEDQRAGYKSVQWNPGTLASGVYFYRLSAGHFVQTRKLLLLR